MKKRLLLTAIIFSISISCFAQQVEKLGEIKEMDLIYKTNEPIFTSRGSYEAYEGISVNEVDQIIRIGGCSSLWRHLHSAHELADKQALSLLRRKHLGSRVAHTVV